MQWTTRILAPTAPGSIAVGPCAWRIAMLPAHAAYVHAHPSLLVATPDDSLDVVTAAAPHLGDLPVMLGVHEPSFARELPALIDARIHALGRAIIDILYLHIQDTAELKGGGMLQTLWSLRDSGRVRHIGMAVSDVRSAEWLALNTAARVLVFPWSLDDQSARHRTIPTARDYGMACITLADSLADAPFLLATTADVLPIFAAPLPTQTQPWSADQLDAAWQTYIASHEPPAPLPRSRPPEEA